MTTTRGDRLREARSRLFRSARSAAASLGIPPATYGAHERAEGPNGRDYGPDEAIKYGRHFNVAPEWLLTGGYKRPEESTFLSHFAGGDGPFGKIAARDKWDIIEFLQELNKLARNAKSGAQELKVLIADLRRADFGAPQISRKNFARVLQNVQRLIDSLDASGGLTLSLAAELELVVPAKGTPPKPLSGIDALVRNFESHRRPPRKKK